MKREIKFRAWDKRFNSWISDKIGMFIDGDGLIYYDRKAGEEDDCVFHPLRNYGYKEDDIELMQFTGLKDKNGKEIYEGDIVNATYEMDKNGETIKSDLLIIDFGEYSFRASSMSGETRHRLGEYFFFKIIGNIYENPELIKTE